MKGELGDSSTALSGLVLTDLGTYGQVTHTTTFLNPFTANQRLLDEYFNVSSEKCQKKNRIAPFIL